MNGIHPVGFLAPREGTYTPIDRNGKPLKVALSVNEGDRLPIITDADVGLPLGYVSVGDTDSLAKAA